MLDKSQIKSDKKLKPKANHDEVKTQKYLGCFVIVVVDDDDDISVLFGGVVFNALSSYTPQSYCCGL